MKKLIVLVLLSLILNVGCSNTEIDKYKSDLENKSNEIANLKNEINDLKIKYNDLINSHNTKIKEYKNKIKELEEESKLVTSVINNVVEFKFDKILIINNISLGITMDEVKNILGENYTISKWNYYENEEHEKWIYPDSTEILFLSDKVYSIKVNKNLYTNFGIRVTDSAKDSIYLSDILFNRYFDEFSNKEHLGWYTTNYNELIILYFNAEDRFNENINLNDNTKVEAIEIIYNSSFD